MRKSNILVVEKIIYRFNFYFVSQGASFYEITCPFCSKIIKLYTFYMHNGIVCDCGAFLFARKGVGFFARGYNEVKK